jgi:hypothetical protein
MAFITLRRSRNTSSYYLVESYRDEQGRSRKRTLCYLGREQDGTGTLAKALAHWEKIADEARRQLSAGRGKRQGILRDRVSRAERRTALLRDQIEKADRVETQRRDRQRRLHTEEEANRRRGEETQHWQAIERLHRFPSAEHAQAAKRAFRILSLRHHPDQGGSHEAFIRLKTAYDRAAGAWRRQSS